MTSHVLLAATTSAAASSAFQLTKPSDGQIVTAQVIGLLAQKKHIYRLKTMLIQVRLLMY